jgi:hypothetical protein
MPSTNGLGVGWRIPSSGRTSLSGFAQRACDSHAIDGVIATSRSVRSGAVMPTSSATRPPMLWPSTCARSIPSLSSVATTHLAKNRAS